MMSLKYTFSFDLTNAKFYKIAIMTFIITGLSHSAGY